MRILFVVLILIAIAGGLIALLVLRRAGREREAVPAGARAGELTCIRGSRKVGDASYRAENGTLVVPENRSAPSSRLIALPVTRVFSPDPNPAEPIFYLAGGPGMSNMKFRPPTWLLAHHDVVMVGYRGVDGTPKLEGPEIAQAMKGVDGDALSPASIAKVRRALSATAARLQSEGIDLTGYTMPETVADMEAARQALGYSSVDLLSESYGTRVAQIYAYLHPERIHRSIMIGVNAPGHLVWEPAVTDAQVRQYAALYRRQNEEGEVVTDLAETMRRVNRSMPARWLFVPIDPGKVKTVAFVMLFHRTSAPIVFDAYRAAERGDASGLALMSVAFDWMLPSMMTWGEFFAIGSSADFDPARDYARDLAPADSILGAPLSLLAWAGAAEGWPIHRIDDELRRVHRSDVETLLVSGSIDFSTPADIATRELLPSLSRGRQVILSERGHVADFWHFQPAAAERLVTSFYDTGAADDSRYAYLPMDFTPALRFPMLAKILLGTGVLLVVALGAAFAAIARRARSAWHARAARGETIPTTSN